MSKELTAGKSAARCGFQDLAEKINEAHKLAREHAESAIEYAFRVGDLLIKSKDKVPRGKWLPWLRENVKFSERSAQAYMRLASSQKTIIKHIADDEDGISVRKAIGHIARPLRLECQAEEQQHHSSEIQMATDEARRLLDDVFSGDLLRLGTHLLERPFCAYDVEGDDWPHYFKSKLLHQAKINGIAEMMLRIMDKYDPIPLLRLVSGDELGKALERLLPLAENKEALPIETRTISHAKRILGAAECLAGYCVGAIFCEFDHRETIDDETYADEYESVRKHFVATSQARLDAMQEVTAQHKRGEFANIDDYDSAFQTAEKIQVTA